MEALGVSVNATDGVEFEGLGELAFSDTFSAVITKDDARSILGGRDREGPLLNVRFKLCLNTRVKMYNFIIIMLMVDLGKDFYIHTRNTIKINLRHSRIN